MGAGRGRATRVLGENFWRSQGGRKKGKKKKHTKKNPNPKQKPGNAGRTSERFLDTSASVERGRRKGQGKKAAKGHNHNKREISHELDRFWGLLKNRESNGGGKTC